MLYSTYTTPDWFSTSWHKILLILLSLRKGHYYLLIKEPYTLVTNKVRCDIMSLGLVPGMVIPFALHRTNVHDELLLVLASLLL